MNTSTILSRTLWIPLLAGAAILLAPRAGAQEPLLRRSVGQITLIAPRGLESQLEATRATTEALLPELEKDLGSRLAGPFHLYLLPPRPSADERFARLDQAAPEWAAAFVDTRARVGALRVGAIPTYPHDDLAMVLVHEIAHVLIHDAIAPGDSPGRERIPRWLDEGLATWLGRRWGMRDFVIQSSAVLAGRLPALAEIDQEFATDSSLRARRAYAASFAFVRWSVDRYGDEFPARLVERLGEQPLEEAWPAAGNGESLAQAEQRWRRGTLFLHRWLPVLTASSTLWLGVTGLFLLAGVMRRRRTKAIHRRWDQEEAEMEARTLTETSPILVSDADDAEDPADDPPDLSVN